VSRSAFFLLFATLCVQCSHAQEPAKSNSNDTPADPDNKHLRVARFVIAPHQEINLPVLEKESLVICLRGDSLTRIPVKGQEEKWASGPGSAVSNRSGVTYIMVNNGDTPAELLVIELKESYAIAHLRVPWTERDPENVDPAHFRMILENSDARVLLLHLNAHEGTMESQFSDRLEIALGDMHFTDTDVEGKTQEVRRNAGSVSWEKVVMHSEVNLSERPLDNLIVELKHPFCYEVPDTVNDGPGVTPSMKTYRAKVREAIDKKWMKNMPRAVRELEDKGLVLVQFRIEAEGTIPEDGLRFRTVFADDSLMEKALRAVRDAGPFPPFPPDFQKPFIISRFFFLYNLPAHPPGCR
jgi:hypothetical protein